MEEIWKDIEGYEGLYQISSLGKVRSLNRDYISANGGVRHIETHLLKQHLNHKGYNTVFLYSNGKRKEFFVHRLVAQAFIPNHNNLPQVNHKTEIKTENSVENLEWCDNKYNCNYGTRTKRVSNKNINGKKSKPIIQYSMNGKMIKEYPSISEACRELGYSTGHITECCKGEREHYHFFKWKYKREAV